jgi:hypothetical protein
MLFMVHCIIQGVGGNADGNKVTITNAQLNFMYIKQFGPKISNIC